MPCVRIAYCELDEEPTDTVGWAYRWPLSDPPQIGDRVFVTSGDSQALSPAVVIALDRGEWTGRMKWVRRRATKAEIRNARWLCVAELEHLAWRVLVERH